MGKSVPSGALDERSTGPFSPVLIVPSGELVVISGQGPVDADGTLIGETIEQQTEVVLEASRRLLALAGASLDDVIKVNVYLADLADWPRFNAVYSQHFFDPRPARTAVGVDLLFGMLVEVDMWALRPQKEV